MAIAATAQEGSASAEPRPPWPSVLSNALRTSSFWIQILRVYLAYKVSQVRHLKMLGLVETGNRSSTLLDSVLRNAAIAAFSR